MGLYLEGRFKGGFFALPVWGLIFGGAYFWNFTVIAEMLVDCWLSSSSMLVFSGGSRGEPPPPPVFLDQTKARRTEKILGATGSPLSKGLDDRVPPLSQGRDLALGVDKVMRSKRTCPTNIEGKSGEICVCCS